jgi:hypothetical protein
MVSFTIRGIVNIFHLKTLRLVHMSISTQLAFDAIDLMNIFGDSVQIKLLGQTFYYLLTTDSG